MSRKPRQTQITNSQVYHVLNRGILRQTIFHDDQDAQTFLQIISRYKEKANFEIYHWCLMPNHYHFLAKFVDGFLLSKVIGACQQIYVLYYHRKYNTAGKLFQNRFKSQAIEQEKYFFACARYIELNPKRAGLVNLPWEWKWTSARHYILSEKDDVVSLNPLWKESFQNLDNYRKWILDSQGADIQREQELFRSSTSIIGSVEFRRGQTMQDGRAVPIQVGRPRKKNRPYLSGKQIVVKSVPNGPNG